MKAWDFWDWRSPFWTLSLIVVIARESLGLARLAAIENLHRRAPTLSATTAPRAKIVGDLLNSHTAILSWRERARRCKAMPTTSSTAPI